MNKNTGKILTPIIGLEVHVELATRSKMFCGCRNDPFGAEKPNSYTCPVCLGLPGALPVPNRKAIEWTVMLGLALGCRINRVSRFDRKHYFYPDLPKGYQISQYLKPFAVEGWLNLGLKKPKLGQIRIRRVHLEEDTGKLIHKKAVKVTLVDFNRSGVPLLEIVTEPDIRSAEEAKAAAKKIQQIVRFLGISDADMEKGSMRLEANVSLANIQIDKYPNRQISKLPPYKVELKNINSFRFMERAIRAEIERQARLLSRGAKISQQTRGWDSQTMSLKTQRVKETEADYRYFPEPDIPPIRFSADWISKIKKQISKMPDEVYEELTSKGIRPQEAEVIAVSRKISSVFLEIIESNPQDPTTMENLAKWILHHKSRVADRTDHFDLLGQFKREGISVISDEMRLKSWVEKVVSENNKAVADYRAGKKEAIEFLIGQVQKKAAGKANVPMVKKMLLELLG